MEVGVVGVVGAVGVVEAWLRRGWCCLLAACLALAYCLFSPLQPCVSGHVAAFLVGGRFNRRKLSRVGFWAKRSLGSRYR